MKVLFVTRKWPPAIGGMELYSRELAAAMARYADVNIEALPGRPDGSPPGALALIVFFLRAACLLAWRGRRYDVVHFGDFVLFPLAAWAALFAPRARRLVSVHGLDLIYGRRAGWKPFVYRVYTGLARGMQGVVHCFVANSSATASVAADIGLRRVSTVPLGVTLNAGGEGAGAPLSVGAKSDAPYLLFVGRIVPRKGLAWFAGNVLPRLPAGVTLKIAGTAWDKEELRLALENPCTTYLGRIEEHELRMLRLGATATIMPNRHIDGGDMEGFGLAALEAAADGSVLLASRIEGLVDAVVDGETGFLIDDGDADAWVEKLSAVLSWAPAKRADFLAHARGVIAERYSWDRVARDTLALAAA